MSRQQIERQLVGITLIILLLAGCGTPQATPASQAAMATDTQAPAADTPTPEPPTPSATSVPPTDAPTAEAPAPSATPILPTDAPTGTTESPTPTSEPPTPAPKLSISTTAFEPGGDIPTQYSCFGDNLSPALAWSGVPAEAKSLALIVHDLDAGAESGASTSLGFAHWLVYNIPPTSSGYAENMPSGNTLADGALQGNNDFAQFESEGATFPGGAPVKLVGYDGPCPGGKHRYNFHLYALDSQLDLPPAVTPSQVLEAMEGHILAQAEVVGSFAPPQ